MFWPPDLARRFSDSGIAAIITTDIATDGTLAGPNLDALREMAQASSVPVIASGGIGCMADLLSLLPLEDQGVKWRDRRPGVVRRAD
jgi:phosphoribosylformimino-5-aminoimidazole carboxamide ribotide isomerase